MSGVAGEHLLRQVRQAYEQRQLGKARVLCERLLGQTRRNPEALYLMGCILHAERRLDEAAAHLERCATLAPKHVGVLTTLALLQLQRGRLQAALARVEKVLRLAPGDPEAIAIKAEILDARGEHEKVRALLEPRLSDPAGPPAKVAYLLARARHRAGDTAAAIDLLRGQLARADPSPPERQLLGFELGRYLERAGDDDAAFAAYAAANAAVPGDDDPDAYDRRVDEVIAAYAADFVAAAPRADHGLETPVLVVGMPRCGSTLIEQILERHPRVDAAGESLALWTVSDELAFTIGSSRPYPWCVRELDAGEATRAGRAYVEALHAKPAATRIVDKNLTNFELLGLLALIVPGARVLDCRRDPVNTCFSCFASGLDPRDFPFATDLAAAGRRYRAYARLMDHWRGILDLRMLPVQYEEVVADQEGETRRILEFLGLPWDDRCLRFHESRRTANTLSREQVRQPIYRTSVDRAARFERHLGPLREALG